MMIKLTCPLCSGTGRETVAGQTCPQCGGTGEVWRTVEQLMWQACRLDDEIKARTAEHIGPLQQQLDDIKAALSASVIETGATVKTEYGRIEYVRAGERVTWDDRALLGFAVAHPEILQMRSTKETQPTTRIKFEVQP